VKTLFLCISMALAHTPLLADQWGVVGDRAYNYDKGTNYFRSGNRVIGSDGSVITKIQSDTFEKGGIIYRRNGEFFFGSDGSQWRKMGNTWLSNNGKKCRMGQPLADCDAL
jgi:hypothetical protein